MVMPIPESAGNMGVRIVAEQQYGVLPGSPTWKRLNDVKMTPKPQFETDMFIPSGFEVPSVEVLNDDFTNFDVTGRLSYTSLMYVLSSMFGWPTTTLVGGSTYDHVWEWDGRTPIVPASYSLDYGTAARARRTQGVVFNGLTTGVSRSALDFSSSAFGKDLQNVSSLGGVTNEVQTATITGIPTSGTFTLTFNGRTTTAIPWNAAAAAVQAALEALPTIGAGGVTVAGGPGPATPFAITFTGRLGGRDVALMTSAHAFVGGTTPNIAVVATTPGVDAAVDIPAQPVFPLHYNVYVDDSWALSLAKTTQLLALYNMSMGLGERLDRSKPVNSSRSSDNVYIREDQEHTVGLKLGADAVAEGMYSTIRAGMRKFVNATAIGPATGDSAYKYEFESVICTLLSGTDGYDTESGIHVLTWNGRIAYDDVSGKAARFRLRNKIASL